MRILMNVVTIYNIRENNLLEREKSQLSEQKLTSNIIY